MGGTEYIDGSQWSYTSNCTFLYGGAYKIGRMVQIVLRVKVNVAGASSNPPLIQINDIPFIPAQDTGANLFRFWATGEWKTYGKEVSGYIQGNSDLSQNGLRISLCNPNIVANDELSINFSFICQ